MRDILQAEEESAAHTATDTNEVREGGTEGLASVVSADDHCRLHVHLLSPDAMRVLFFAVLFAPFCSILLCG